MSLPAMSFGNRFCVSRKDSTRGGGWVHLKGANSMAMSGLSVRKSLVGSGKPFSLVSCTNGLRKQSSQPCKAPHMETSKQIL